MVINNINSGKFIYFKEYTIIQIYFLKYFPKVNIDITCIMYIDK